MFYHKVYMNQVHSSSLLCQLAMMWKNQVLCDAVIKTGNISTKAHRVVLVAACPMLHSMKNASTGSNLEIRLAADIKQEAITTFLQYLYEGFMMLTEDNCKDVEKIARVLQVDSVLKCCSDFYKCLHTGSDGYEYNFHDSAEFRHVRASEMLKVHDRLKRGSDSSRPTSPGAKRQRFHRTSVSSDQGHQEFTSPVVRTADPWDRIPKEGLVSHANSSKNTHQPGIIDMVEDSVEILNAEPPDDSGGTRRSQQSSHDRVAISVASQMNMASDVQIVNVTGNLYAMPKSGSSSHIDSHTSALSSQHTSQSLSTTPHTRETVSHPKIQRSDILSQYTSPASFTQSSHKSFPLPHPQSRMPSPGPHLHPKPFAAGSISQASSSHTSVSASASTSSQSSYPQGVGSIRRPDTTPQQTHPPDKSNRTEAQSFSPNDVESHSDLSIVKIETPEDITNPEGVDNPSAADPNDSFGQDDPASDWGHEEASNEGSVVSVDRQQWMSDSFKDTDVFAANTRDISLTSFRTGQQRPSSIDFSNYVMVGLRESPPPGYLRLDEDERVCVPQSWLSRTMQHCTGKPAFFTLKKLVDGFVNPWECKYGGTSAYKNTPLEPVFNALLYPRVPHDPNLSPFGSKLSIGENVPDLCHRHISTEEEDSDMPNDTEDASFPGLKAAYDSTLSAYLNKLVDLHSTKFHPDKSSGGMKGQDPIDQISEERGQSSILQGLDLTVRSQQQHIPIYNKDRKYTPCLYCGKLKNRTRSGWRVNTFYRCQQCDVPLCVNDRNCFVLYHRYFLGIHEVGFRNRRRSRDGRQADLK